MISGMDVHESIERQYRAALRMLEKAILLCPDPLWLDVVLSNEQDDPTECLV